MFKIGKRLFRVCAQTNRLVPCGPAGHGYDIRNARKWFRVTINAAVFVLQVLCSALGAMLAAPLLGAGAVSNEAISAGRDVLVEQLSGQVEGLCVDDGAAKVDLHSQVC